MKEPRFLTLAEIHDIHADQIKRYGGSPGVRDQGALMSAMAQPSGGIGDSYFHENLYEMAAAYAFHLSGNHPFVDGNKRAALAATLVFLKLNGISLNDPVGKLYDAMIEAASGRMKKPELADLFRKLHGKT